MALQGGRPLEASQSKKARETGNIRVFFDEMQLLYSLFLFSLATSISCESAFLPGVKEQFEVRLRSMNEGTDITTVEVFAPKKMLNETHGGKISLEQREEGGCWQKVTELPIGRGRKQRWRVAITPCREYSFRLALTSSCVEYLEYEQKIGGATFDQLEQAKQFKPTKPSGLRVVANTLEWSASPCIERYEVAYSTDKMEGQMVTIEDTTSSSLSISSEDCQEVVASVTALSGNKRSSPTKISFPTCTEEEEDALDYPTMDIRSFLFDDKQSCPSPNLPLCFPVDLKPSPELHTMEPPSMTIGIVTAILVVVLVLGIASIIIYRRKRTGKHRVVLPQ